MSSITSDGNGCPVTGSDNCRFALRPRFSPRRPRFSPRTIVDSRYVPVFPLASPFFPSRPRFSPRVPVFPPPFFPPIVDLRYVPVFPPLFSRGKTPWSNLRDTYITLACWPILGRNLLQTLALGPSTWHSGPSPYSPLEMRRRRSATASLRSMSSPGFPLAADSGRAYTDGIEIIYKMDCERLLGRMVASRRGPPRSITRLKESRPTARPPRAFDRAAPIGARPCQKPSSMNRKSSPRSSPRSWRTTLMLGRR